MTRRTERDELSRFAFVSDAWATSFAPTPRGHGCCVAEGMFPEFPFVIFSAALAFAVIGGASAFFVFEQRAGKLVRWTRNRFGRAGLLPRPRPVLVTDVIHADAPLLDERADSERSGTFETLRFSDRSGFSNETLDSSPKRFVRASDRRDLLEPGSLPERARAFEEEPASEEPTSAPTSLERRVRGGDVR